MAPILKISLSNRLTMVLGLLAYPGSTSIRKARCEARTFENILASSGVGIMLKIIDGGEMICPALSCVCKVVVPAEVGA
jgi:hypothetical protein